MIEIPDLPAHVAEQLDAAVWRSYFEGPHGLWLAVADPRPAAAVHLSVYSDEVGWARLLPFLVPLGELRATLLRYADDRPLLPQFAVQGAAVWSPVANWLEVPPHVLFLGQEREPDSSRSVWQRPVLPPVGVSLWLAGCLAVLPGRCQPSVLADRLVGEFVLSIKSMM